MSKLLVLILMYHILNIKIQ